MKKKFALLLTLAMLFTLAACGTPGVDKDAVGTYYCIEAERTEGIDWPDGERIELYEDGTCIFYEGELSGWETPGKWSLEGSDLTLRFYGEKYEADLSSGELELEDYEGTSYLFSDDESDIPDEADRPVEEAPANTPATSAPGESGDVGFDIGYYTGSYGVTSSSAGMSGEYVELYDDLTGYISTDDGVWYFDWTINGEDILIWVDGEEILGYNDGYVMEFDFNGVSYTFEWEVEPGYDTADAEDVGADTASYWNRDWYGWWYISDGYGSWEDATGNWWDCAAVMEVDGSGYSTIELWDEDYARYDLMAYAEGWLYDYEDGGTGYMELDYGYFMDSDLNGWSVDPEYSYYGEMLIIEGYYQDPNVSEDYFYYSIYLRPWGYVWTDIEADSPEDLPYYYYDWYLPAIEAGAALPDVIGGDWTAGSAASASAQLSSAELADIADALTILSESGGMSSYTYDQLVDEFFYGVPGALSDEYNNEWRKFTWQATDAAYKSIVVRFENDGSGVYYCNGSPIINNLG